MNPARYLRLVKLGVKTLWLHKLRSMLTMLGMVFGVASVIAMLAVGRGASEQAMEQIRQLGSHNIIINSVQPSEQSSERVRMSVYGLLYGDQERIENTIPTIVRTVPAKLIPTQARVGTRQHRLRVVGTTPAWFELVQRELVAGRTLNQRDMITRANVVVLTEDAARRLLATEQAIGNRIRMSGNYYEVVGIIRSQSTGGSADLQTPDRSIDAYIPIATARERFGDIVVEQRDGATYRELVELHQLIVQVDQLENVESTARAIERALAAGGRQRSNERSDTAMSVPWSLLQQAEATERTFNIVLGSIAGISLLVGGIGIMNIMLASVTERTREIGIRRAIGAKRSQIVGQFLIETMVLSTTGGLLGIAVGVVIPQIIEYAAGMPTVIPLWGIGLSLGISVAVGIIFGLYPAIRAAKLDPIVALRYE